MDDSVMHARVPAGRTEARAFKPTLSSPATAAPQRRSGGQPMMCFPLDQVPESLTYAESTPVQQETYAPVIPTVTQQPAVQEVVPQQPQQPPLQLQEVVPQQPPQRPPDDDGARPVQAAAAADRVQTRAQLHRQVELFRIHRTVWSGREGLQQLPVGHILRDSRSIICIYWLFRPGYCMSAAYCQARLMSLPDHGR